MGIIDARELTARLDSDPYNLIRELGVISDWPDYRFRSVDGRDWGLFFDGRSIESRMDAKDTLLTRKARERLRQDIAGFILEITDEEAAPMVYGDVDLLLSEWLALHGSFGVPLSAGEKDSYEARGWDIENQDDEAEEQP